MITPMDIHNKTFSKGLRGYSEEEVNDFLKQIVADYEQIYREHREMEEELDQMKVKLKNYENISETMASAVQLAKDTAENVKKNAKKNADMVVSGAQAEADRQVKEAESQRRRLVQDMLHTEGNMKTYISKIKRDLQMALTSIEELEAVKLPVEEGADTAAADTPDAPAPEEPAAEDAAPETEAPAAEETEAVPEEAAAEEAPETTDGAEEDRRDEE